jgi:hypothetical protein
MATRRAQDDAAIRAQYYRSKQRSPQAQAIARRIEEAPLASITKSERVSRWNRGADPTLQKISDADLALASGGYSTVGVDPAVRRERVRSGAETELPDWLPEDVAGRLREKQKAMGGRLAQVEAEQREAGDKSSVLGTAVPEMKTPEEGAKAVGGRVGRAKTAGTGGDARDAMAFWSETYDDSKNLGMTPEDVYLKSINMGPEGSVIETPFGVMRSSNVETGEPTTQQEFNEREGGLQNFDRPTRYAGTADSGFERQLSGADDRALAIAEMTEKGQQRAEDLNVKNAERAKDFFASLEEKEDSYQEGRRAQRDALRRITQINRELANAPKYGRRGGEFDAAKYLALQDELEGLRGVAKLQEKGSQKQLTDLGRQIKRNRQIREGENRRLREAMLSRAETARGEANTFRTAAEQADPYVQVTNDLIRSYIPSIIGGGFNPLVLTQGSGQ